MRHNMTPAEAMLWNALRTNMVAGYHFCRQQVIGGFIVDFYCHATGLVTEVDGPVHEHRREYDAERDAVLATHDLWMLRFSNDEVLHDLSGVLTRIQEVCAGTTNEQPS